MTELNAYFSALIINRVSILNLFCLKNLILYENSIFSKIKSDPSLFQSFSSFVLFQNVFVHLRAGMFCLCNILLNIFQRTKNFVFYGLSVIRL